jgi:hypothetical protein
MVRDPKRTRASARRCAVNERAAAEVLGRRITASILLGRSHNLSQLRQHGEAVRGGHRLEQLGPGVRLDVTRLTPLVAAQHLGEGAVAHASRQGEQRVSRTQPLGAVHRGHTQQPEEQQGLGHLEGGRLAPAAGLSLQARHAQRGRDDGCDRDQRGSEHQAVAGQHGHAVEDAAGGDREGGDADHPSCERLSVAATGGQLQPPDRESILQRTRHRVARHHGGPTAVIGHQPIPDSANAGAFGGSQRAAARQDQRSQCGRGHEQQRRQPDLSHDRSAPAPPAPGAHPSEPGEACAAGCP